MEEGCGTPTEAAVVLGSGGGAELSAHGKGDDWKYEKVDGDGARAASSAVQSWKKDPPSKFTSAICEQTVSVAAEDKQSPVQTAISGHETISARTWTLNASKSGGSPGTPRGLIERGLLCGERDESCA